MALRNRVLGQIGVHAGRADTHQHGKIMRVEAFGRSHGNGAEGAKALADQVAMHSAGGKDHRDGDPARPDMLVSQHDMFAACAHSIFSLAADTVERLFQFAAIAGGGLSIEGTVDLGDILAQHVAQTDIHAVRQHRAFQHQHILLGLVGRQHIAKVLEPCFQAHHPVFPKGIDGRIGDLAEILPEEMAQGAELVGQHGRRGVIAHGADGFLAAFGHGRKDQLHAFKREAGRGLHAQALFGVAHHRFGAGADFRIQLAHTLDPVLEGLGTGQLVDDLTVIVELAGAKVGCDHAAGGHMALAGDRVAGQRAHAGLAAHREDIVRRQRPAQGAQAVPVQARHRPAPVKGADRRRPVPGLHDGIAVGIERGMLVGHDGGALRPRLRDHHRLDHGRGTPGFHHHLEYRVQRAGIGKPLRDHRLHIIDMAAEIARDHANFVAFHPVEVPLHRVDLAIMGEHAERLCQAPLREGVGRIALVIDREAGGEALILQVEIEIVYVLGQEHALVDQGLLAQRADIEGRDAGLARAPLYATAADIERTFQLVLIAVAVVAEHDLLDLGAGVGSLLADHGDIDRRLAPAIDIEAEMQNLGFHDGPRGFLHGEVRARQKDLADADINIRALVSGALDLLGEEVLRHLDTDARPVAGLAIGIDSAAVPDIFQSLDAHLDNLAARAAIECGHEANSAGIGLMGRIIGMRVDQFLAVCEIAVDFTGHDWLSLKRAMVCAPVRRGRSPARS